MKFKIEKESIEITIEYPSIVFEGVEIPQLKSWSFTKDVFKKQSCDFEPLPQNVIEWMNS